jgi:tRNA-Thr(GGU) m(6)t(6)A37 methyltransferase TsaA
MTTRLNRHQRKIMNARARGLKPATTRASLHPIGIVRSTLKARSQAPRQGNEGAPDAWIDVHAEFKSALNGIVPGDEIIVITWFHRANRDVLKVRPRSDSRNRLTGVFATRSPDRPNPLGLHPVTVRAIEGSGLRVGPIEAIDGTPIVDIKPVLKCAPASKTPGH